MVLAQLWLFESRAARKVWMRHCSSHALHNAASTAANGKIARLVKLVAAGDDEIKVQKCIQSSMKSVRTLEGSDLQLLTASLAMSRFREKKAWAEIASIVTKKVAEIKVGDLRQIAGSFSFARKTDHEMLAAISSRFKESPESLNCFSWADFIFSLRTAGMQDAELLKVAADAMFTKADDLKTLKTRLIIAFLEASLVDRVFHQGMLCVLSQILVLRMQSLNAYDLSKVALTWGKAQLKDDLLLQSLSGAVRQKVSEFPKSRISFTIHGLSLWGCQDKGLLRDLAFAWTSMSPEEPLDACSIICALAKSEALDGPLCDHIAACSLQFVPHFDSRNVARILLACSQAECKHVEFLEALGRSAAQKASQFTAHDLCAVALAGAKLSLSPILGTSIPEAAVERVSEFDGAQIALMMDAVSKLSDNPGKFLPALESAALPHVSSFKALDLRHIAVAWAKAQAADGCLMKAVAQRAEEVIETLDYSAAHHIARAYSNLEVRNPALFAALAETGRLHLGTTGTSLCDEAVEPVALADEFKVGSNNIVQRYIDGCLGNKHTLKGRDLGWLTASLASSGTRDENAWAETASIVTRKVAEIKADDLVQIAGSFSRASQTDHEMLAAISSRFKESPESLNCWCWADFIFSLQRAGIQDAELLKVAADAMLTDADALKRLKTSLIMALVGASLDAGVFHQGMLCVLSQILVLRMESLNAHDLSRVALTWGTAQLKDDLLLQSVSGAVRQKVSEFPKSRISFTIQGLSSWGCQDKSLLRDLAFAWTSMRPEEPRHALHIICTLAKSEALDGPLCDRIAACSLQFVPHFDSRNVARILLACSQAECKHVDFLEALGQSAAQKASQFTAHDLCAVALAGAKLSLAPILGTSIPEAALERVSEFDGAQIALMMHTVSKLSDNPGKFLPALERAALPHVFSLKALDLRNIAMAWVKVQAADDCLMKAVAQRAVEVIDTLDYSAAHHIARAYSNLEVRNPALFVALAETGRLHLGTTGTSLCDEAVEPVALADEFKVGSNNIVQRYIDGCLGNKHTLKGRDLGWLTASLASGGTRDENAWAETASIVTRKVAEIKADDLVQIAGSFSRASQPDREMLAAISSRFKESPESLNCWSWADFIFSLQRAGIQDAELLKVAADAMLTDADALKGLKPCAIKTLLDAYCSQAECTPVQFLEALGRSAVQKASEFAARDLCAVAFAGSKLSLGPILGTSIPEAAVERVAEFDGAQIALMMDAVSELSDNPGKFLPALERAAVPHVSSLKAADLRHIAVAWAKAQAADSCLMKAVAQRAVEVIDTLDPSTVCWLAVAYSELRVSNPELFAALGARCNQVVHALQDIQLPYIAFAFVQANVDDNVLLDSIAKEALTRFWKISTSSTSLLVRAFTQANLESAAVTALLENLAIRARCQGRTQLYNSTVVELSDLQKQYVETVQEVLPFVLVNQRHQMGLILTMAVIQDNGTIVNLEVDPEEVVLSNLELTFRSRRDEFLESIGVEVLRFKVKSLDDLKYHLQEIFGSARPSVEQTAFEAEVVLEKRGCGEDLELQDLEIPCQHLWKEIEPSTLHSQSSS